MLAANVLCLKKKKKRTYSLSSCKADGAETSKNERSRGGRVTMIPITEDTPPDMLAGAMDLAIHLPSGKSVKMSVERSTPMMDLLVQVTTANHLQLSNYTLQVLGMAPSSEHSDKVLPFKPNTPIGTLDTQHIRVLPKERTVAAAKYTAPGHQPFESTFRLKVHLPRNQLYVTRVSRNVLLEDIMKKVCGEKNLDPTKFDFKHPGNLDQILDPKFTLSDYQITEIYVVAKGTTSLNQAFSAADIMVLRKEEERKQMHNKTGGGVFNLIFKRGKSSMGSGSVSSDNRSISPTQSDDSRSVTPPAVQVAPSLPPKKEVPPDRPKAPQRKRRPAPKPPQAPESSSAAASNKAIDTGLTICHSRNSSDSSGYHEASILSDHCANTSLPRMRPKSALVGDLPPLQGSSNLTKMTAHSQSTTSLVTGRRKKAAPPPPPPTAVSPASSVVAPPAKPSPLVASQPDISNRPDFSEVLDITEPPFTNPVPVPKPRTKVSRPPRPKSYTSLNEQPLSCPEDLVEVQTKAHEDAVMEPPKSLKHFEELPMATTASRLDCSSASNTAPLEFHLSQPTNAKDMPKNDYSMEEILTSLEAVKPFIMNTDKPRQQALADLQLAGKDSKPPEVVGVIPKTPKEDKKFAPSKDSFGKKRCFQIGKSLEEKFEQDTASLKSRSSRGSNLEDEISDLDESMFVGSLSRATAKKRPDVFSQLFGMHSYEPDVDNKELPRHLSITSLGSAPALNSFAMRKWGNSEDLDSVSTVSYGTRNRWVAGDASDTESVTSANLPLVQTPLDSLPTEPLEKLQLQETNLDSADSGIAQESREEADIGFDTPPPPPLLDEIPVEALAEAPPLPVTPAPVLEQLSKQEAELVDIDWHYQLPSPPKAFRDSSPSNLIGPESGFKDSVVTSPELFEKLRSLEESQSERETVRSEVTTSTISEEPLNTLSLEHLEKRKSLVYNRELATSLKMTDSLENSSKSSEDFASSLSEFQVDSGKPKHPPKPARSNSHHYTLPNFKISTYDVPKHQNIKVFEDDTIRSNTHGLSTSLSKTPLGQSMENISFAQRHSMDAKDYVSYKSKPMQVTPVSRSGSFSTDNRTPLKPVSRSKSTLTLNKYHTGRRDSASDMSRSNSLFDVSGLQSLEVMKLIQNKLNTPPGSQESIPVPAQPLPEEDHPDRPQPPSPEPVKKYHYRGPPAVNMSTWSERPKKAVAVKEDEDYKLGNVKNAPSKSSRDEVRSNGDVPKATLDFGGSEITQKSGNVVIKIGANKNAFMGPTGYRRPLASLNGSTRPVQRPHSIALDSGFDLSRVPVVRSVELKKPYQDKEDFKNTSITHLNQDKEEFTSLPYYDKAQKFRKPEEEPAKRVLRMGSFKPLDLQGAPVVRGFKPSNNDANNRLSWNPAMSYSSTLPLKPQQEKGFNTNQFVPFSQSVLRRTESSKRYIADQNSNDISKPVEFSCNSMPGALPPPPPPQLPKVALRKTAPLERNQSSPTDPRDTLLESIRNFGGKKGLRAAKV